MGLAVFWPAARWTNPEPEGAAEQAGCRRRQVRKAVVYTRYGPPDVLRLTDVPTPVPKDDEVLVKVHAVSLNASDWEVLRGKPLYSRIGGPFRPRHHILGLDIAGRVEAAGCQVTRFRPGQDVFADILSSMGGFAEYVCVPEAALVPIPAGLTYEEAAALPQAGPSRTRDRSARAQGADQWRRRWLRHVRHPAGQAARGRGHWGGQRREAGVHALPGCGPRHRLHAG